MSQNYKDLFFEESQEYLKAINQALVKLEKDPADTESINIIFRLMHTFKGMAATMGYQGLSDLSHSLEDVFSKLRSGDFIITDEIMDLIFESVDVFIALIDDFKENRQASTDITLFVGKLNSIAKSEKSNSGAVRSDKESKDYVFDVRRVRQLISEGKKVFNIEVVLVENCQMKAVRAFLVIERAKKLGEILKSPLTEQKLKDESFDINFEFIMTTDKDAVELRSDLMKITDVFDVTVKLFEEASFGEFAKKDKASPSQLKKIYSMRITAERLDIIMNIIGELSMAKGRFMQIAQTKNYSALEETAYINDRLVSSLQEKVLELRLIPISYIVDNFPRIVRDLSKKTGKKIDLAIYGSEIELDRVILEDIGDPLVHIVRNAVDHGIEMPDERARLGKPIEGTISIKISREKGHIVIEISDDGKGIDFTKIIRAAASKGLIPSEEASNVDVRKVLDVLSLPGFSTKETTDTISGRGVGMDAVRSKLDAIGGSVDLESQLGKGTKFILTLPLTIAIIKAMLISVGGEIYIIPLMNVKETVKVLEKDIKFVKDIEVIRRRDEIIPVIRLAKELSLKPKRNSSDEISIVIIEGRRKELFGFIVDKVIGDQDVVVKPLTSFVKKVKGVTGATILGDGRVALILDTLAFGIIQVRQH
ncbi:MAG: chemotaxis protein CheA [Candidatus Omnitrophota bacterium]